MYYLGGVAEGNSHHLICQDAAEVVLEEQGEPAQSHQLVRLQFEPEHTPKATAWSSYIH